MWQARQTQPKNEVGLASAARAAREGREHQVAVMCSAIDFEGHSLSKDVFKQ